MKKKIFNIFNKIWFELKTTFKRIWTDLIIDKNYFGFFVKIIELMEIGNRTPSKFYFILSQLSSITIICTLLFDFDLNDYKRESIYFLISWVFILILGGYIYRRTGLQKKEDEINKDMNHVAFTNYGRIKEIHQVICNKK